MIQPSTQKVLKAVLPVMADTEEISWVFYILTLPFRPAIARWRADRVFPLPVRLASRRALFEFAQFEFAQVEFDILQTLPFIDVAPQ